MCMCARNPIEWIEPSEIQKQLEPNQNPNQFIVGVRRQRSRWILLGRIARSTWLCAAQYGWSSQQFSIDFCVTHFQIISFLLLLCLFCLFISLFFRFLFSHCHLLCWRVRSVRCMFRLIKSFDYENVSFESKWLTIVAWRNDDGSIGGTSTNVIIKTVLLDNSIWRVHYDGMRDHSPSPPRSGCEGLICVALALIRRPFDF